MKIEGICKQCGMAFLTEERYVKRGAGKFCSATCARLASRRRIEKICKQCGGQFITYACRVDRARTCSFECKRLLAMTKMERACLNCERSFLVYPSELGRRGGGGKYCSRSCASQGLVKLTITKPVKDKYGRSKRKADKDWTKAVKERDAFTCQRCGKVEGYIHAHHVAPRSRRPDLRHVVSNGKCLCSSCHQWVHWHPKEATALGLLSDETYERTLRGEAA